MSPRHRSGKRLCRASWPGTARPPVKIPPAESSYAADIYRCPSSFPYIHLAFDKIKSNFMKRQEIKTQHSIETVIISIAHACEVGDQNGEGADIMSPDLQAFEIAVQGFYLMIAAAI